MRISRVSFFLFATLLVFAVVPSIVAAPSREPFSVSTDDGTSADELRGRLSEHLRSRHSVNYAGAQVQQLLPQHPLTVDHFEQMLRGYGSDYPRLINLGSLPGSLNYAFAVPTHSGYLREPSNVKTFALVTIHKPMQGSDGVRRSHVRIHGYVQVHNVPGIDTRLHSMRWHGYDLLPGNVLTTDEAFQEVKNIFPPGSAFV